MAEHLRFAMRAFVSLVMLGFAVWAALAVSYRFPGPDALRLGAAITVAAVGCACAVSLWLGKAERGAAAFAILAAGILTWWSTITPPATADFAPEVARQATLSIAGERMTVRDLRSFRWRSETDVTEVWDTRDYDLSTLASVDLFLSHWDNSGIAHMIMSFGFADGAYIAWSIEVRRTRNGAFSPLADLFKSNTLVLVVADERDVIGLRSNIRGEDVHRYRLNLLPQTIRSMLLEYAAEANRLAAHPAFYNSLTTNCTTTIVAMMRAVGATVPLDWRLILNGRLPDYAFDHDALETGMSLEELKRRAPIGQRAKAEGLSESYSAAIRKN